MNKYYLFFLVWLLPAYMLFIGLQQVQVHFGTIETYQNGESYLADVLDFDIKQIAAQSNGYIVLRFKPDDADTIQQKLSLTVQMAQAVMDLPKVPVRYQPESTQPIVMIPTYDLQKSTSTINAVIALIGLVVLVIVSVFIHRFAKRKIKDGDEEMVVERVDV